MSSKNVVKKRRILSVPSFKLHSGSLVKRLMALYALSTMGILFAVGLFLYPTFNKLIHPAEPLVQDSAMTNIVVHHQQEQAQTREVTVECYKKAILALLFSAIAALGLGYGVARNSLRRLKEFESQMNSITANLLNERVNPSDWPRELENLAKTFNEMLNRIQTSFIALTQFSSDLAHELRTPVNNLRGLTEVALSKNNPSSYRQVLESHLEEYTYLSRLIDNLLFIARSEQGQIPLQYQPINVRDEILKICEFYQAVAQENNVTILCQDCSIELNVDTLLFRRVINNLLSNALRYSPAMSTITFRVAVHGSFILIEIVDEGVGIGSDQLEKIFDRFYRIDQSRSALSGGLGLGLTIVKAIMDLHKGRVVINSALSVGTTVQLFFPHYFHGCQIRTSSPQPSRGRARVGVRAYP